jgi:hypothetical protein
MLFLFLFGGSVSICFYAIIKQKVKTNMVVAVTVIALLGISAFGLGMGFEKYRYHEYYIFRFSQFSQHIATLAEQQRISELTNSVILFNQKFAAGTDPKALEDVVFEILKVGKYYSESETNTQEFHK